MISENRTTDKRFGDQWLFEFPKRMGASGHNPYDDLIMGMQANSSVGHVTKSLGDNLFMMQVDANYAYYWIEKNGEIEIIAGVMPFENGIAIGDVGKKQKGSVWASDFYKSIVKNSGMKLLFSGDQISDEGHKIWKNLLKSDSKLFGYDSANTNHYQNIDSEEDLEKFLGDTETSRNLRFVLSENVKSRCGGVWTSFEMYRIHRLIHKY